MTGVVFRTVSALAVSISMDSLIIDHQAVREGGRPEWEAVKRVALAPKNPYQGLSAMRAMGASKDLGLAEETFQFILNEARDQDTFYYAGGLQRNFLTRKFVAEKFKEHFATVSSHHSARQHLC